MVHTCMLRYLTSWFSCWTRDANCFAPCCACCSCRHFVSLPLRFLCADFRCLCAVCASLAPFVREFVRLARSHARVCAVEFVQSTGRPACSAKCLPFYLVENLLWVFRFALVAESDGQPTHFSTEVAEAFWWQSRVGLLSALSVESTFGRPVTNKCLAPRRSPSSFGGCIREQLFSSGFFRGRQQTSLGSELPRCQRKQSIHAMIVESWDGWGKNRLSQLQRTHKLRKTGNGSTKNHMLSKTCMHDESII